MKRYAASHVVIDNTVYTNHVVEVDEQGNVVHHYPLTAELPATEWHHELHFTTSDYGLTDNAQ